VTRKGPSRPVEKGYGRGRLEVARAFLKAAQDEATLADDTAVGNPIVSQVVNAAIAYADTITGALSGRVNQQDHAAAVKALRDALGQRLPEIQARRLRRILAEKDAAQYGARLMRKKEAMRLLADLEEFARWAETEIVRLR
jgi:hypothetical protein